VVTVLPEVMQVEVMVRVVFVVVVLYVGAVGYVGIKGVVVGAVGDEVDVELML
jgi:hypothetical protein